MSLKIKTAARLKALFPGVALSKKSVEAIGDQFAKAGLTDESTEDEIDAKLNERNALYSFEDQKKFEDYQIGKANKEAADRKKAEEEGKTPPPADDPNESSTDKLLKQLMAKLDKQEETIASMKGEKVATTRREQFIQSMKGTSAEYQARELKRFDRIAFKDDDDFNSFMEDTKEEHAGAIQDEANGGLGNDRPQGGGGNDTKKTGEASQAEVDAAFKNFKL